MRRSTFVILGILAAIGCGGSDARSRERRSTEPPAATTTEPTPPAAEARTGSDPIGDELRAAPSWALMVEPRVPGYRAGTSHVPELADAARLYESLPDAPGPLGAGVLLCRVMLTHSREWDASGVFGRNVAPDVTVYARSGGREARVPLPEDAYDGVFSLPLASVDTSTRLEIRLVDRDLASDDSITTFTLEAPISLPIVKEAPLATMRCRAMPAAVAMTRARLALGAAGARIANLGSGARTPTLEGEPRATDDELAPVRGSLRDAASALGYAHPEVHALVERLGRYEDGLNTRLAAAFDAARARTTEGPIPLARGTQARALGLACARDEASRTVRCRLRVEADYTSIPRSPGFAAPIDARLYARGLRPLTCMRDAGTGTNGGFVRSAGRVEHAFTCDFDGADREPEGPWLVRLGQERAHGFVRVGAIPLGEESRPPPRME